MLFRRKPPVWQWDDRFSLHVHHDDRTAPCHHYTYTIPYDHHAHLIAGAWHVMTAIGGTPRQVRLFCWRGQIQLYCAVLGRQWAASQNVQENFGTYGYPTSYLIPPNAVISSMIPHCLLHPGDRITVDLINPQALDDLSNLYLTFKFWNA